MNLVYKTDFNHSYASRELIAICDSDAYAVQLCINQSIKDGKRLAHENVMQLIDTKQTQGHSENEFQFETMKINQLL